jgi:para-nitrobenzyl esterase
MVFIHGGAFTVGAGSWSSYRGTKLAEKGVVVVTIHYRLGPFGFLTLPELKGENPEGSVGNYGISDQIVALQWVHENISAFGGDPNNVTIFGESAGAMSVCTLLAIPSAHPYFHKAIMESGGCSAVGIPPTSYTSSLSFVERTGCGGRGDPLRCLRSLSPKELLLKGKPDIIRDGFQPQVDSVLLQEIPLKALEKGIAKEIPLLAGANDDELMLGLIVNPPALSYKWKGWSAYEKRLKEIFPPEEASALLTLYPKEKYPDPVSAWEDILGDYVLRCPTYFALDRQKRHQNLVFHYHFNWDKVFKRSDTLQSFHALELAFVFGPYDVWSVLFGDTLPTAIEASEIIQNYWVEFAKKGDPNREDLPPWVPFTEGKTILLGEKVELIDDPLKERCSYWDGKIPTGLENLTKGIWSL